MEKIKLLRDVSGQSAGPFGVWILQSDIDAIYEQVCKLISGMKHDTPDGNAMDKLILIRGLLYDYCKVKPIKETSHSINGKLYRNMNAFMVDHINLSLMTCYDK